MRVAVELCEIDILFGSCVYGEAPCTAQVGVTGPIKCFNTRETCQDIEAYAPEPLTLRFGKTSGTVPIEFGAIPSLVSVEASPSKLSIGKSLGERASITFVFKDHRWADTGAGFDKYRTERPYDASKQGTFWGKLRARHRSLNGCAIRWITGFVGQSIEEMETRHFIIESIDGPRKDGTFAITAKDILKLADGDKSQTPPLSNGFLLAALTATATSFTISPPGTGNKEYPASGYITLGGNETVSFTRVGDAFTIVRGQLNTTATTHQLGERVQLMRRYVSQKASAILADIFIKDCGVDPDDIPLAEWQAEDDTYVQVLFSRDIAEATSSRTVIDELIEQAGLSVWSDDLAKKVRMMAIRGVPSDAVVFSMDTNIVAGSFSVRDQPETRISQVITRFGLRNPLLNPSEVTAYRCVRRLIDVDSELLYGTSAIREINATWIPAPGNAIADRGNERQLGRFANPPRRFTFQVSRTNTIVPQMGMGARLKWPHIIQDATGAETDTPIQITRVLPRTDVYEIEAEEMLVKVLSSGDLANRVIGVPPGSVNYNLKTAHDSVFPQIKSAEEAAGITVTAIIESDVTVTSNSISIPAFDQGIWPFPPKFVLEIRGRIVGRDGNGGKGGNGGNSVNAGSAGSPGQAGGNALKLNHPTDLKVATGGVYGGRGGGGGGGGGGGAAATIGNQTGRAAGGGGGGGGSRTTPGARGLGGTASSTAPGENGTAGSSNGTGGPGGEGPDVNGVFQLVDAGDGGRGGNAGSDYGQAGSAGQAGGRGMKNSGIDPTGGPRTNDRAGGAAGAAGPGGPAVDGWSKATVVEGPGDIRGAKLG